MKSTYLIAIILFISMQGYSQILPAASPTEPDPADTNYYQNADLGWKMAVPNGRTLISNSSLDTLVKKIIDSSKSPINIAGAVVWLAFQKNKHNTFFAISQHFPEQLNRNWERYQALHDQGSYADYIDHLKGRDMKCDSATSSELINGIKFHVYHIRVYFPNGRKFLDQFLYAKLIHGSSFGVAITASSDEAENLMLSVWSHSVFDSTPWQ